MQRNLQKKNGAYYTVVIAQKIEQLAKTRSIRTLSPQETVDLAEKTAKDYHFEDKTLRKIQIALSPAYDAVKKTIDFEKAFSIMKAHTEDGDIYRAARLVLRQMQKIPQDMQAFMGNYEKESGINVNLAEAMDAQKSPSSPGPKKFDI